MTQTVNRWRDWFQLCRLPNAFTAVADPLAGALIVGAARQDPAGLGLLMMASACLYTGGVVLNDWADFKRDLIERSERPLPSGRIRRIYALLLALGLLTAGGMTASSVGQFPTMVTGGLIAAIALYDILLKDIPVAPVFMGACRSLNLLLGMSLAPVERWGTDGRLCVFFLIVMGLYITGVTLFARKETGKIEGQHLIASSLVTWVAIIAVAAVTLVFPGHGPHVIGKVWIALLLAVVGYRMMQAILTPTAGNTQRAVKTAVLGVILLDAGMVGLVRGLPSSLPVIALLVPAIWLGRRLSST